MPPTTSIRSTNSTNRFQEPAMKNLGNMLKQAQQMQAKMQEMQAELEAREVQGAAGGGMVTVTLNGKSELKSISIDPALMKEDEREVLEDLIKAAHADAKGRVEREMAEQMQKLTAGMPLPPGMKLPF
jgi:nucleoid-associated protein EbfC